MPAFDITSGDVVRHVTYCTAGGQVSTNSRDYQLVQVTGGTVISSGDFLITRDGLFSAAYSAALSSEADYYGSQLYKRTPVGPAPRPDQINVNPAPGTFGAGLLPTQTCGLISLYTAIMGKTGQGRFYMPFPSTVANTAPGGLSGGYLTALNDFIPLLTDNITITSAGATGLFRPCLYVPGGAPPKFIYSGTPRTAWATQRKRGAFGKTNSLPF